MQFSRARSSRRYMSGITFQSDCSTASRPLRASSTGVSRMRRISSVSQTSATTRCSASRVSWRSRRDRSGRSFCASRCWIRWNLSATLRRTISVGWAVSTSSMSSPRVRSWSSAGDTPASSSLWNSASRKLRAPSPVPASTESAAAIRRRRRIWWCCSAMLARFRNWANARASSTSWSLVCAERRATRRSTQAVSPWRASRASWRTCSTSSYIPSPWRCRMVLPSRVPSRRTSSRSPESPILSE